MNSLPTAPLLIEIASDVVCPWCYIGKRRLEAALQLFAAAHPEQAAPHISWLPFQLNPDMPAQGMSRADYLQRKFGSADGGGVYERVSSEGRKEGLAFDFKAITRQPSTLKAHALIAAAAHAPTSASTSAPTSASTLERGSALTLTPASAPLQGQLKEALMVAYFMQGQDLSSDAVLTHIATSAGLGAAATQAALQDTAAQEAIATQEAQLRNLGISGVPFFIINRQFGVSGAQPPEALLAAMEQALGEAVV